MIQNFNRELSSSMNASSPSNEVIVKLRTGKSATSVFSNVYVEANTRNTFSEMLADPDMQSIKPLFEEKQKVNYIKVSDRRSRSAMTVALEDDIDPKLSGLNVLEFKTPQKAADAVIKLASDPLVEYAHIPAIRNFATTDPNLNRQWGLRAINYFKAAGAAGFNNGKSIKIAILDSGIDPSHPDLSGTYIVNQNFSTLGNDDDTGHGTHVAGIIAAIANNGIGIAGVSASIHLMILRGLTRPYQATAYYKAIQYATTNGAQVLNMSLGGPHDPTEALLISDAINKGVIVVAAMGNEYQRGNPISFPAALPDVIAIGACTETDKRAEFSNTGPHIDIVAPGTNILSTVPGYKVPFAQYLDYDVMDGTSMATPFVAGAIALLLAKNPKASLADVTRALHKSAVKIDGQTSFTNEFGHGRLDIEAALRSI